MPTIMGDRVSKRRTKVPSTRGQRFPRAGGATGSAATPILWSAAATSVGGAEAGGSGSEDRSDFLPYVSLDEVSRLDVLEPIEANAAVEARAHLGDVVLEAPQRRDLALVDHPVVPHQPDRGVARDEPLDHVAAGHRSHLRHLEGVADLGAADRDLAEGGLEQAGHRLAQLVEQLVDDGVQPDVDLLLLGELGGTALRADVEADRKST